MNCLNPTQAWIDPDRKTVHGKQFVDFSFDKDHWHILGENVVNERFKTVRSIALPCGKCILCRKRRGFEIGIRARCEAVCHDVSSFVTLTVSDENLELVFPGGKLRHRPFQLFAKRLRKTLGKFRFIMCGEYGETTRRPHYHVIIFGRQFLDGYSDNQGCWHGSKLLESVWPYGHVTVDRLNDNRIMYVAGYVLKDSGANDEFKSYVRWSRRPGLGAAWFDKFWSDCYKRGGFDFDAQAEKVVSAVIWHRKLTPFACRYFDERLQLYDARLFDILKAYRQKKVGSSFGGTLCHSSVLIDNFINGLRNRVEVLTKRLASHVREPSNRCFVSVEKVNDKELIDDSCVSV